MRDPERIDRLLKKIGEVWKKYPDMRLTQLLYFLSAAKPKTDLFNLEDSVIEEALDKK